MDVNVHFIISIFSFLIKHGKSHDAQQNKSLVLKRDLRVCFSFLVQGLECLFMKSYAGYAGFLPRKPAFALSDDDHVPHVDPLARHHLLLPHNLLQ